MKKIKRQINFLKIFVHFCTKESTCNAGDPGSIPGSGRSAGEGKGYSLQNSWASLVTLLVKNLPVMWETWVRSLTPVFWHREFHGLYIHGIATSGTRPTDFRFPSLPFTDALGLGCCAQAFSPCDRRGLLSLQRLRLIARAFRRFSVSPCGAQALEVSGVSKCSRRARTQQSG